MQGAAEVLQAGRIQVYRLLQFVTSRVIDAAAQFGKAQHPTLRGRIDGELTWPIFSPGAVYNAAFPDRAQPAATADVHSLASY
jgi:hypothetical protein